jgi:hypothetical protein
VQVLKGHKKGVKWI